jgi:hypothetical protein
MIAAMYDVQLAGNDIWISVDFLAPLNTIFYITVQISPPVGIPEVGVNGVLQDTFAITYTGNFQRVENP